MMKARSTVRRVYAPPPRPTRAGALWLASIVALPVGLALWGVELVWRVLML